MRVYSQQIATLLAARHKVLAYLIELRFDSATVYFTTAAVDLEWEGRLWVGLGKVADLTTMPSTTDLSAPTAAITLSGLGPAILSLVQREQIVGRTFRVALAVFDPATYQIVGIIEDTSGYMSNPEITDNGVINLPR